MFNLDLGITVFTKVDEKFYGYLILFTLIIILVARYLAVIPLSLLTNLIYKRTIIPRNHQLMIWFSGLRGAIAFALSFEVTGNSGAAIRTTVLSVCVITIILLGASAKWVLGFLSIETGVETVVRGDCESDSEKAYVDTPDASTSWMESVPKPEEGHWFVGFDSQFIKPLFLRNCDGSDNEDAFRLNSIIPRRLRESLRSFGDIDFNDHVQNYLHLQRQEHNQTQNQKSTISKGTTSKFIFYSTLRKQFWLCTNITSIKYTWRISR